MAYRVLPDSPQYYVEYDASWPGVILHILIFAVGYALACIVGVGLTALISPGLDTSRPDIGSGLAMLIIVVIVGISRLIKYFMLSRIGGHGRLNISTWRWATWTVRSAMRYVDVYDPDIYLTRDETVRINLAPHGVSLVIVATLLAFGTPMLQVAAILSLAAKTLDILPPLLNLIVVFLCPADTLFVESSSGVLDVYRSAAPRGR